MKFGVLVDPLLVLETEQGFEMHSNQEQLDHLIFHTFVFG